MCEGWRALLCKMKVQVQLLDSLYHSLICERFVKVNESHPGKAAEAHNTDTKKVQVV